MAVARRKWRCRGEGDGGNKALVVAKVVRRRHYIVVSVSNWYITNDNSINNSQMHSYTVKCTHILSLMVSCRISTNSYVDRVPLR